MPKPRIGVDELAANIAGSVLAFSAQTTQQIGELLVPRPSFLKRTFSSHYRNAEQLEVLKLNCDIVLPHLAVAEYNLEHGDYWDRDNSDIAGPLRQLSIQAVVQAFEKAGHADIDANFLVRDRAERFAIYSATALLGNISEEILKDHQLPSNISVDELIRFLGPSRISTYKELWAEDQERTLQLQQPSIGDLLGEVYRHWRGEDQSSRDWNGQQFNLILEGSLAGLNLVITKACYDIDVV